MNILTKESFDTATEIPYVSMHSQDISEVHAREFMLSVRALANMLVAKKLFRRPDEKKAEVVYWFSPCVYQYMDEYGKVHFVEEKLDEVFGSPEHAYEYYKKIFKEAFPGFDLTVEKTEKVYDYKVKVKLNFE